MAAAVQPPAAAVCYRDVDVMAAMPFVLGAGLCACPATGQVGVAQSWRSSAARPPPATLRSAFRASSSFQRLRGVGALSTFEFVRFGVVGAASARRGRSAAGEARSRGGGASPRRAAPAVAVPELEPAAVRRRPRRPSPRPRPRPVASATTVLGTRRTGYFVYRDESARVPWVAFVEKGSKGVEQVALRETASIHTARSQLESILGPEAIATLRLSFLPRGQSAAGRATAAKIVRSLGLDHERVLSALQVVKQSALDFRSRTLKMHAAQACALEMQASNAESAFKTGQDYEFRFCRVLSSFLGFLDVLEAYRMDKGVNCHSELFKGYTSMSGPLVMRSVSEFDPSTIRSCAECDEDEDEGSTPPPHTLENVTWSLAEVFWSGKSEQLAAVLERLGMMGQEQPSTLQATGDSIGITRERMRQCEEMLMANLPTGADVYLPVIAESILLLKDEAPLLVARAGPLLFRAGLAASPDYHFLSLLRLAATFGGSTQPLAMGTIPVSGLPRGARDVIDEPELLTNTLTLLAVWLRQAAACGLATAASVAAEVREREEGTRRGQGPDDKEVAAARRALRVLWPEAADQAIKGAVAGDEFEEDEGTATFLPCEYVASDDGDALWFRGPIRDPAPNPNAPARLVLHRSALKVLAAASAHGQASVPLCVIHHELERATMRIAEVRARTTRNITWRAVRAHAFAQRAEVAAALATHPSFRLEVWRDGQLEPAPAALLEWLREGPGREPGGDGGALARGDVYVALGQGLQAPPLEDMLSRHERVMVQAIRDAQGAPGEPLCVRSLVKALMARGPMSGFMARNLLRTYPFLFRIRVRTAPERYSYFAAWDLPRHVLSGDSNPITSS